MVDVRRIAPVDHVLSAYIARLVLESGISSLLPCLDLKFISNTLRWQSSLGVELVCICETSIGDPVGIVHRILVCFYKIEGFFKLGLQCSLAGRHVGTLLGRLDAPLLQFKRICNVQIIV